jgi:uncharacterized protein
MTTVRDWKVPAAVFALVSLGLVGVASAAMMTLDLKPTEGLGAIFILAAMWIPSVARLVTVRTVDKGWVAPLPLKRWGRPRLAVIALPLLASAAVYVAAYAASWFAGIERGAPTWDSPGAIALNVAINLPLLAAIGLIGGLGEELGWRGYLQPRLDQAGVRGALLWVIVLEWAFHLPIIVMVGYLQSTSLAASLALFFVLKLGATPLWTWGTYKLRSIWVAVWFHSLHNALSQTIFPKALGAGDPLWLDEAGLLPGAVYVVAAAAIVAWVIAKKGGWTAWARSQMSPEMS